MNYIKNRLKKRTMMGATPFLLATAIGVGTMPQIIVYADTTQTPTYRNYYIDNERQSSLYFVDGETFLPGAVTAKYLGLDYDDSVAGQLTIKKDGNEYVFKRFCNYYTKNGEKVYIKEIEQNGVKIPDGKTNMRNDNNHLFIPLSFFEKELGLKFNVDSSNNLYLGKEPNNATSDGSADTNPAKNSSSSNNYSTENSKLTIDQGWVAPTLKSTSEDDLKKDAQTLIKELEFVPNGTYDDGSTTSATFDAVGLNGGMVSANMTTVGPIETSSTASHFNAIIFNHYRNNSDKYFGKADKIDPQVLRFYYPNSWEWLDSKLKEVNNATSDNPIVERYTIDGRDTVIEAHGQIIVYMSRVGGSLSGRMLDVSSSGTIGSAYSFGHWVQSGNNWCYLDASGKAKTGWIQDKGNWYYLDPSTGVMRTGWIQDGGNWYYCWSNGQMASNTTVNGYTLNGSGVWVG